MFSDFSRTTATVTPHSEQSAWGKRWGDCSLAFIVITSSVSRVAHPQLAMTHTFALVHKIAALILEQSLFSVGTRGLKLGQELERVEVSEASGTLCCRVSPGLGIWRGLLFPPAVM